MIEEEEGSEEGSAEDLNDEEEEGEESEEEEEEEEEDDDAEEEGYEGMFRDLDDVEQLFRTFPAEPSATNKEYDGSDSDFGETNPLRVAAVDRSPQNEIGKKKSKEVRNYYTRISLLFLFCAIEKDSLI